MSESVIVPSPQKIDAIIISLFPPKRWIPTYKYAKTKDPELGRYILFADAIPGKIIREVARSRGNSVSDDQYSNLCRLIYERSYWTHLYKEFADDEDSYNRQQKYESAQHLSAELNNLISENLGTIKAIIALGNSNWKFLDNYQLKMADRLRRIQLIRLPIPIQPGSNYYLHEKYQPEIDKLIAVANIE